MLNTKLPCEIQRVLLAEYMAALEKVAAQLERAEVLNPSMDSIRLRGAELGSSRVFVKPLLQELKVGCNVARARYLEHRKEHGCSPEFQVSAEPVHSQFTVFLV